MRNFAVLLLALFGLYVTAHETFPVNDIQDERAEAHAFINATIFTDHQTKLEGATLLIRDRLIEAVGKDLAIPEGYKVVDLAGLYIYPSFIDPYTTYGVTQAKRP